ADEDDQRPDWRSRPGFPERRAYVRARHSILAVHRGRRGAQPYDEGMALAGCGYPARHRHRLGRRRHRHRHLQRLAAPDPSGVPSPGRRNLAAGYGHRDAGGGAAARHPPRQSARRSQAGHATDQCLARAQRRHDPEGDDNTRRTQNGGRAFRDQGDGPAAACFGPPYSRSGQRPASRCCATV
ncbi:MAG: hypothetical protein AVDCRST_MAG23-2836, partial [uncultured Sphingosinicella sp.]